MNRYHASLVTMDGHTVEVSSNDLYASIDKLVDKIDRVLTRHKTKLLGRAKSAKGESIRKAGSEEELPTEELTAEEMEGVFLTYEDEEETQITSEGYRST